MPAPNARMPIRTPDQRLRIFVSSTLQELVEERRAAKAAIERLRLAPVMFELGARPHPPRELYRAYLMQSDVFVGIYWQRYGWVAPGEELSGLEDEYRLSGERPKLIYVKGPAPERDPRLGELLERIQGDDRVSYKPFETAEELRDLLENDLALLLTERFEFGLLSLAPPTDSERFPPVRLPIPSTPLVGRREQIEDIVALLSRDEVRLVTLLGPGGIGKTRLALAVAERLREAFADGVAFVPLAAVRDATRVFDSVVEGLGLKLEGGAQPLETLKAYLLDKNALLVLDNFEQVLSAASEVAELLVAAPRLHLLITSRAALRLSAEYIYPLSPLTLPAGRETGGEAVELFLERARAVRVDIATDEGSLRVIAEIVRRLDGLPLAIELAAARTRLLSPPQLLARLERRLDLLTSGPRDLPDRQQTLRGTLDWSFGLLQPHERRLFVRLGVFVGGASLEAIEAISSDPGAGDDLLDTLLQLVDHSLVKVLPSESESRFGMLETVREYALEKLEQGVAGSLEEVRERHMRFYLALAERLGPKMKFEQHHELAALGAEHANLRLAIEWCLAQDRDQEVVRFAWALWLYWWIHNDQETALPWLERLLARAQQLDEREHLLALTVAGALYIRRGEAGRARDIYQEILPRVRLWGDPATEALVCIGAGLSALTLKDYGLAKADFLAALGLFRDLEDAWGIAFVHAALARIALASGDAEGAIAFTEPLVQPTLSAGDENTAAWILHVQGLAEIALGRLALAAHHLGESLELFSRLGNLAGAAHVIGSIAGLALAHDDTARAMRLAGASEALSEAVGALPFQPERSIFESTLATACRQTGEACRTLELEGRALDPVEAFGYARQSLALTIRGLPEQTS